MNIHSFIRSSYHLSLLSDDALIYYLFSLDDSQAVLTSSFILAHHPCICIIIIFFVGRCHNIHHVDHIAASLPTRVRIRIARVVPYHPHTTREIGW